MLNFKEGIYIYKLNEFSSHNLHILKGGGVGGLKMCPFFQDNPFKAWFDSEMIY